MRLRCGKIFYYHLITYLLPSVPAENFKNRSMYNMQIW